MRKRVVAQKLIQKLNAKLQRRLNFKETLLLGVVLKGLPVAYSLARINDVMDNFVPLVAQRTLQMQHYVESNFPSLEWELYFKERLSNCGTVLIVDDVVNSGFTKQKLESIVYSMSKERISLGFCALILNQRYLTNPNFVSPRDTFVLRVNAGAVECDWGVITVPLMNLSVKEALVRCGEYFRRFWLHENRVITITY
jgi:adenine/guanine phosphoribosyltransferase-like PRPP-binding protein